MITSQPIFKEEELTDMIEQFPQVIGPDTLLLHYQFARTKKDWKRTEELKAYGKERGWELSFHGDSYAIYQKLESNHLFDSLAGRGFNVLNDKL